MERTSIIVRPETRKQLQLRKQEWDMKNVDEVIIEALTQSGADLKINREDSKKE